MFKFLSTRDVLYVLTIQQITHRLQYHCNHIKEKARITTVQHVSKLKKYDLQSEGI